MRATLSGVLRPVVQPALQPVLRSPFEGGGGAAPVHLKHILVMGQSNGVALNATPVLSTNTSRQLMFNGGTIPGGTGLTSFTTLVESPGETVASGMTHWLTENTDHAYLVSNVSVSGQGITAINKTTTPYNNALAQVTAAKALATSGGYLSYEVIAVVLIHGEQDQQLNNTNYATQLATMQSDFQTDAKAISLQVSNIPFFACQQNGYSPSGAGTQPASGTNGSATAYQLLAAGIANPTKIYVIPRYNLINLAADQLHLTNHSQRWQGERYGKLIHEVVFGSGWDGLYPTGASITGAVITVTFDVPVSPLVFDYALVRNPGVGKGFEYFDDSGAVPAITGVALNGATSVDITLASPPSGYTYRHIRYAHTPRSSNHSGPYVGARGCLRDSDSAVSDYGYPLYNHCPHFVRTF